VRPGTGKRQEFKLCPNRNERKIMTLKIEHIGIAVNNIKESVSKFTMLGLELKEVEEVEVENVPYKVAFLTEGNINIELVNTTAKNSLVTDWLEKHGEGVFHLAFEVADLEKTFAQLQSQGVKFVWNEIKNGSRETRIALIQPEEFNGVYIELVQKK
jgi:methylmalonyl-CoA/ethylmalonyl-CoA epimerase